MSVGLPDANGESPGAAKWSSPTDGSGNGSGTLALVGGESRILTIGESTTGPEGEYRMAVTLTTVGASVLGVELNDHALYVDDDSPPYPMLSEVVREDGTTVRSFEIERINIGSESVLLQDRAWLVEEQSPEHVTFSLDINGSDGAILRLHKTYRIPKQTHESMRSDLRISLRLQNLGEQSISVIVTRHGAVGIRREDRRFNDRGTFVGLENGDAIGVEQRMASRITEETSAYQNSDSQPLIWTALANKYFVVFETPVPSEGENLVGWVQAIKRYPAATDPVDGAEPAFRLTTIPIALAAGQSRELTYDCYLGPKSRDAFTKVDDYRRRGYDEQVLASYSMGACAFMTFTSLTTFMIWMLNWLELVVHNYGVAIIVLVLFVRTILHPITKKGQVNMMRMQQQMGSLGPKMEEIKKRFANDKAKINTETMKLYQEAGINPATGMLSSCLPMMLQMPIWIALYTSLNHNIDMRHQPFMLWIRDLSAPDALIPFSSPVNIPLISSMTGPITAFNLLPILVSAAMFAQQKLMPKPKPPAGQSDEKAQQAAQMQKMMPYMTLMFGLFFYNMPSGLNLYIGASSFFGMIEQWRIRKHIEELKNAPPRVRAKPKVDKGPSFFQRLQKAAEEAQKVKTPKRKKRGK